MQSEIHNSAASKNRQKNWIMRDEYNSLIGKDSLIAELAWFKNCIRRGSLSNFS